MLKLQITRERAGMSREQLAKKAKVALSKIYLYESGKGNPTQKTFAKLAKALECNIKDLIE